MHTLTGLGVKDNIVEILKQRIELFDSFEEVYLFGSTLQENSIPNDVDILLVYDKYFDKMIESLTDIRAIIEEITGLSVDLTALSVEEEKNVLFLERLNYKYLKLK